MTAVFLSLAAFLSTVSGGLFALKFRDDLHFILSFTAGVLLGVVSFDILPEIFELARKLEVNAVGGMVALVTGFLMFHVAEKFVLLHHGHESDYVLHHHPRVGFLSAVALIGHSFMDGVGIGLGFQVSSTVGAIVAIAVITHDFCDGINTVGLMLVNRNTNRHSRLMLMADAAAPIVGAASTLAFSVPPFIVMVYLGFFAGFLLYIAASDILPEAHSRAKPETVVALMGLTCAGAAFVFLVVRLLD